jgi:tRNA uridine 5-carbamoylmethylation protein Kti12
VDPFALIMLAIVGGGLVVALLLGRFYPGSGAEQLDWRPTRSVDVEVQNEIDDVDQMLEAANERRRARGLPERTIADVEASIREHRDDQRKRHDDYLADQEIDELLALKNERRARRGLPPVTREEYEAELRRAD